MIRPGRLAPVRRVAVEGDSMLPTVRPGDRLLVSPWMPARPGHLVAVRDPRTPARLLVKRVDRYAAGGLWVLGDNPPASTDSRQFGPVPRAALVGRVFYRYHPALRAGPVDARSGGRGRRRAARGVPGAGRGGR